LISLIREFQKTVRELRARVSRVRSVQIERNDLLEQGRGIVDRYFRTERPRLVAEFRDPSLLAAVDEAMQDLLRLTQRRSSRSRYLEVLSQLEHAWRDVEVSSMPVGQPLNRTPRFAENQEAIARTLESVCAPAARCYRQALVDLTSEDRVSWRGTASELREALRELLDKLAPDDDVTAAAGFKYEDDRTAPTMKQKVRFILKSRKWSESERKQMEDAADVVEEKVGSFVRSVYAKSSSSVHTEPSKRDVQSVLRFVETSFAELLEL
jgi:hypothetical protein